MVPSRIDELRVQCERLGLNVGGGGPAPKHLAWLEQFEAEFRYPLPEDFAWFMRRYDPYPEGEGTLRVPIPSPRRTTEVTYGRYEAPVYFPESIRSGDMSLLSERMREVDPDAATHFHELLVTALAHAHHNMWYFDYRYDPANPPVVRLDSSISFSTHDGHLNYANWIDYVAPSFTDMVQQMIRVSGSEASAVSDDRPYPFVDEMLAWRKSTFEYLDHHWGPIDPRVLPH